MSLSYKLKMLRTKHNMTQQMLADRMNVARATIAGYEAKNRQPSLEKLNDIANIFGVSIDYLIQDCTNHSSDISPLYIQSETPDDLLAYRLYSSLSRHSRNEVLRYLKLLELWERVNNET